MRITKRDSSKKSFSELPIGSFFTDEQNSGDRVWLKVSHENYISFTPNIMLLCVADQLTHCYTLCDAEIIWWKA